MNFWVKKLKEFFLTFLGRFKVTLGLLVLIFTSSVCAKQVYFYVKRVMGDKMFFRSFKFSLASVALAIIIVTLARSKARLVKKFVFAAAVMAVALFVWKKIGLQYPEEKLHVLEFGALGWFAHRDITGYLKRWGIWGKAAGMVLALLLCAAIGVSNELFQKLLPWRCCDIKDMILDAKSGAIGVLLHLLT